MKVLKNYLYSLSYQVFVIIVPLITIPYISRVLGPKGVGINTLTNSMVQYFVLLANLGLTTYGQRQIAYKQHDRILMTKNFWEIEILSVLATIASFLLFCTFVTFAPQYRLYYIAQSLLIVASAFDVSWLFMGLENFKITVFRNFVFKFISVILIFLFVKNSGDTLVYILILSSTTLLGNVVLWPQLRRYLTKISLKKLRLSPHIRPAIALFIPQIAISIYAILNKVMLGFMTNVSQAAYFDNSDKIVRLLLTVITALSVVMMPHIAKAFAEGKHEQIKKNITFSIRISILFAVPVAFGLSAIAPVLVPWFFGQKFLQVTSVMGIEAFAIIPIAIASVLGGQFLVPLNKNGQYTISIFCGAAVNILINFPLIHFWGAVGASYATLIAESTVTLVQIFFVWRFLPLADVWRDFGEILICSLVMFVIVHIYSVTFQHGLVSIITAIIIGLCVFAGMSALFRPKIIKEIITRVFS